MSQPNPIKKWSFFLKSQPDAEGDSASKSTNEIIQDADKYYAYLASAETGFYPLGQHGVWHGGVHFDYASLLHYRRSIHCLADGEVVATRINDKYLSMVEGANFPYISSGFALIRHRLEFPPEPSAEKASTPAPATESSGGESAPSSTASSVPPANPEPSASKAETPATESAEQPAETNTARPSLTFYSLYMHMFPWEECRSKALELPPFWGTSYYQSKKSKSTDKLLGVRIRPLAKGKNNAVNMKEVLCVFVRGSILRLGEELPGNAKWRKVEEIVSGKAYPEWNGVATGYACVDELTEVEGQEGRWFVGEKAKAAPEETSAKTVRGVYIRETADKKSKILALLQREKKVILGEASGSYSKLKAVEEDATIPTMIADEQGVLPGWIETDSLEKVATVPDKFNVVNVLEPPVSLKAGDVVGYPGGMDLKDVDGGWVGEFPLLHLEVFSGDDVPAFIAKGKALDTRLPDSHKTMLQISAGTVLVQPTKPDTKIFANVDVSIEQDSPKDGEWAKVKSYYIIKVMDRASELGPYNKGNKTYSVSEQQKEAIAGSVGVTVDKMPDSVTLLEELADNDKKARLIGFTPKDAPPCWIARTGLNEQQRRAEMGTELPAWANFPLRQQSVASTTAKNSAVGYTCVLTTSQMKQEKKASDGKAVWWNVSANNNAGEEIRGWVKEGEGATRCSPWAWPGFECIEEQSKPSEQAVRNDVEGEPNLWGDRQEFALRESAKKADQGALLQKLYDIIDCQEQKDGKLTVSEYQKALSKPWLAKQLSRLIVNYESEWFADEGLSKWEALFKLKDPENKESAHWDIVRAKIRALVWYKEVMGTLGLPESGRVWHFHPVGLVECFNYNSEMATYDGKYVAKDNEVYINIITPKTRDLEGPLIVFDDHKILFKTHSLCRGSSSNRIKGGGNGDTPTGRATTAYRANAHKGDARYGNYGLIDLIGESGEFLTATKNGRAGIAIHCGHTMGYPRLIVDSGRLMATFGCVRVYNSAMKELTELYTKLRKENKTIYVYIEDYDGDIKDIYKHYELECDPKDIASRGERSNTQ